MKIILFNPITIKNTKTGRIVKEEDSVYLSFSKEPLKLVEYAGTAFFRERINGEKSFSSAESIKVQVVITRDRDIFVEVAENTWKQTHNSRYGKWYLGKEDNEPLYSVGMFIVKGEDTLLLINPENLRVAQEEVDEYLEKPNADKTYDGSFKHVCLKQLEVSRNLKELFLSAKEIQTEVNFAKMAGNFL